MSVAESLLLLELILRDIRSDWSYSDTDFRLNVAMAIAKSLSLPQFVESINDYAILLKEGEQDGRFFRKSHTKGGYEGLNFVHKLTQTFYDKSKAFRELSVVLKNQKDAFKDWGLYAEC